MLNLSLLRNILFASCVVFFIAGCKKDKSDNNTNNSNNNTLDYSPISTGSSWTYESNDGSTYTLTSTGKDTVVKSRTYKVLSNSDGPNVYKAKSGNEYYEYLSIPDLGATGVERLYLKDDQPVNTTWQSTQTLNVPNIPLPLAATFKYTIKEKDITKTVKSKSYPEVIHVGFEVSVLGLGSLGGGDFYYAKKVGMIEGSLLLSYGGTPAVDQHDVLTTYTIK